MSLQGDVTLPLHPHLQAPRRIKIISWHTCARYSSAHTTQLGRMLRLPVVHNLVSSRSSKPKQLNYTTAWPHSLKHNPTCALLPISKPRGASGLHYSKKKHAVAPAQRPARLAGELPCCLASWLPVNGTKSCTQQLVH